MKLKNEIEYVFRILNYLSLQDKDRIVTSTEIAENENIPHLFSIRVLIYNIGNADIIGSEWEPVVSTLTPFFPFMFILLPLGWILVGLCNLSSKAVVSRWTILLNPVVLMVISSVMAWLSPSFFRKIQPCMFSLGITSYYFICWFFIRKKI